MHSTSHSSTLKLPDVVAGKFTFQLSSEDQRCAFPDKIVVGQSDNESVGHAVLKCLGWLLFYRDRLQIETDIQNDSVPYVPDLVELGYDMRPKLWVECGECSVQKLQKIAVKCPEAEIWILKRCPEEAVALQDAMRKDSLRRGRYHLIGFNPEMVDELIELTQSRNALHWCGGGFNPHQLQFAYNDVWVDATFDVFHY